MVGSLDVTSLYTSIDTKIAGRLCRDRVKNSEMRIQGIDYKWALIYLKLTMSPLEVVDAGVQGILPRKKSKYGRKATIKSAQMDESQERWWYPKPPGVLNEPEKRLIMGCVTEQLVKLVFRSHYYVWCNAIFRQQEGCPMGLQSSCPVVRVVMRPTVPFNPLDTILRSHRTTQQNPLDSK